MPRLENLTARWAMLLALWAAAVSSGGTLLWEYAASAGVAARPPEQWPAHSTIPRKPGSATLVMFAHPRCPCTRASIAELAVLMARLGPEVSAHVLFMRPRAADGGWDKTALWQSASAIPGVAVHPDLGGAEAALFRAATSGQLIVYDATGNLTFRGGITGARGHEGDNVGLARALALLGGKHADRSESKVFGCALGSRIEAKGDAKP